MRRNCVYVSVTGVFGVIILSVGIALIFVFQNMIETKVKQEVVIKDGSDTFKDWVSPPVPIYFQVWVFDVENHDEIISDGAKPAVKQKGPYTYREKREKVNITFNENSTVTYRENRWFIFERDMSVGPENDTFTNINIPFMTIANLVRYEYGFIQELINLVLQAAQENLFIELTVADFLWGYEDNLLKDASEILNRTVHETLDDHFGLFYNQNGSDDGVYNIFTGVENSARFATIKNWNYNSSLPYWTTPSTNMINGTDGTMYPPFSNTNDPIYIFSSDICRSLYATYNYTYDLKEITVHRYIIPKETFLAGNINPANAGFCVPAGSCLPSGLLNVSTCREGAPIIMSQPHFMAANQSVIDSIDGIHPDPKQHQTILDIEPMTGVVMNAAKKLQMNVYVEHIPHLLPLENLKPVFMPLMWLNESASIDDSTAKKFKDQVQQPVKITEAVQYGLITLGAFMLVCVLAITARRTLCKQMDIPLRHTGNERDPLLT